MAQVYQPLLGWDDALASARALPPGTARGEALIELAERRAILHHGTAPVEAVLLEAAPLVEGDGLLEARCLLRLGQAALVRGDLNAADGSLSRALDRFRDGEYFPGVFVTTVGAARLLLRQVKRDEAKALLDLLAADYAKRGEALGPRAGIALSLALAEFVADDPAGDNLVAAAPHFETVLKAIDQAKIVDDDARLDALYGLGGLEQARADGRRAAAWFRKAMLLCSGYPSPRDQLRARLNLGLALASTFEPGPRGEGHMHLQVVVDEARDAGFEDLRLPALMGLVGVYTHKGATDGALDRVLEIARSAVDQGKPELYAAAVALMAEVYASKEDYAQAFQALIKGRAALKLTVSEQAARLIDPHIDALAKKMGQPRFDAMCQNVVAAQEARQQWRRSTQ